MRTISSEEYGFLNRVEKLSEQNLHAVGLSRRAIVEPMSDGGMGSLKFFDAHSDLSSRRLGRQLVQGSFADDDGVPVSFAISVDCDGKLYELDMWRVDFNPLQKRINGDVEIQIENLEAVAHHSCDRSNEARLTKANFVVEQNPDSASGYIERSMIYAKLGMNAERIADLTRAVSLLSSSPDSSAMLCEAFYARGLTYQSMEKHELAISDFSSVLELDEAYSSAFQARAYSHLQIGQLDFAKRDVDRAAELSPNDVHVEELRRRIQTAN